MSGAVPGPFAGGTVGPPASGPDPGDAGIVDRRVVGRNDPEPAGAVVGDVRVEACGVDVGATDFDAGGFPSACSQNVAQARCEPWYVKAPHA